MGKNTGKGKSPNTWCCRFLAEYELGDYDSYAHRCEATDTELPYDKAHRTCYYSDDYKKCPIYRRYN